jgi:hypothetical protein
MSDNTDPTTAEPAAAAPTDKPQKDTGKILLRALLMLVVAVFMALAENVLILIALIQALWMLFTGAPNGAVRDFGTSLGTWMKQAANFQSAATEDKPFPWTPWPAAEKA